MGDIDDRRRCGRGRCRYECRKHRRGLCRRPAAGVGSRAGTVVGRAGHRPSRGGLGRMCRRVSPLPRAAPTADRDCRTAGAASGLLHRCTRSTRGVALGHRRPGSHPYLLSRRGSHHSGELIPEARTRSGDIRIPQPARTGAVHVATTTRHYKNNTYHTHLLRRTFRQDGKVKHETLGNISHLPDHIIDLVRRALKGESLVNPEAAFTCLRSSPTATSPPSSAPSKNSTCIPSSPVATAARGIWSWP